MTPIEQALQHPVSPGLVLQIWQELEEKKEKEKAPQRGDTSISISTDLKESISAEIKISI